MRKKILVFFAITTIIIIVLIIIGYRKSNNQISRIQISAPKEIVIYRNGHKKVLTSKNANFKSIVELTNERLSTSESIFLETNSYYTQYLYKDKLSFECFEFLYSDTKFFNLNNSKQIYTKLFFTIRAEDSTDYVNTLYYGNGNEEYTKILSGISIHKGITTQLLNIIDEEVK